MGRTMSKDYCPTCSAPKPGPCKTWVERAAERAIAALLQPFLPAAVKEGRWPWN